MTDTSLAAVFSAPGQPLALQRFPLPSLKTGEVLVRVSCCTLCGSDIHSFQGRRSTPVPTILGHEIIGRIADLGSGGPVLAHDGRPLKIGDRITWSIAASCHHCFFCEHDIPQKCEHLFKYGHERISSTHPFSGGLAEHCHLAPGTAILRVPDSLSDHVATPANCATATVAAAFRVAGPCAQQTVLIQGAGMLGLTACAMAAARGASQVIVSDVDSARLDLSARFGATHPVNVKDDPEALSGLVKNLTASRGVDMAIELSGAASSMDAAIPLLRIGGRYVLVGAVFPGRPLSISPEMIVRRLLTVQGMHNYIPADLAEAVSFLAKHHARYPFADLVAAHFPLTRIADAFAYAIEKRPLRVAVQMDQAS